MNLVSRYFSLSDMKKYLFCRVLPHINSQKLRGDGIGIPFLTLGTRENNEKLKLSSTNKTHVYSLLVTFDMLRLYVVTDKNNFLCEIFRILIHSDPWSANVIKLSPSYEKFRRVVLQGYFLFPKNIFTGEYQYQYTCSFILIFRI